MKQYNRLELEENDELRQEAFAGIRYDEFLHVLPEYTEELRMQEEDSNQKELGD